MDFQWILRTLETARNEKSIRAILLVVKNSHIGWGQIEEIHNELKRFHETGKRSLAYLEQGDNKAYYLACGAQEVYLAPAGTLELVGVRAEILYFKNLLAYLGIHPQLFSLGAYKSAAEIFTRENMSEANREMTAAILGDLQVRFNEKVAASRRLTTARAQELMDTGPFSAGQALQVGLVDGLNYEDQMQQILEKSIPGIQHYPDARLRFREGWIKRLLTLRRPQIALIVAEGIITSGESRRSRGRNPFLGSETLVGFLRDVRKRKKIKAVVVRINSPGGSALASDLIWRELKLTDEKKPVIVSFSNMAASGGYYIAAAGRRIFSLPATLTGSIGIISGKFNLSELFKKIGITVDSLDLGRHAGYLSPSRPFQEEEARLLQEQMREFYEEHFLKKVSEARRQPVDAVRALAEGRVWTGNQAKTRGLLDEIGGFAEAIEAARQEAKIPAQQKVRLLRYRKKRSWRELFAIPGVESIPPTRLLALAEEWDIS